jgi:hypothetical protein
VVAEVEAYYAAVGRRDVAAALGQWKNPHNKPKTEALIRNTEFAVVKEARAGAIDADHATVWVDVVVKALDRSAAERWQGVVELEAMDGGRWGIVKLNLGRAEADRPLAPTAPTTAPDSATGDRLTAFIRDYYAAAGQGDAAKATAMWKSPPAKLAALVRGAEYYQVNDVRVVSLNGSRASVWVDVVGKSRGNPAQRYQIAVELEADSGRWWIVSMRNLR